MPRDARIKGHALIVSQGVKQDLIAAGLAGSFPHSTSSPAQFNLTPRGGIPRAWAPGPA